jgi:hypothetical protein
MKELIQNLVNKANLNEMQATKAVDVVRNFLAEKLPAQIREPVLRAIGATKTEGMPGAAQGATGKMF